MKDYADMIAKLLRKAESTTPEEAESLYAKAQELMTKYAIDEAMINAARGTNRESEPLVSEEFVVTGIWRFPLGRLTHIVLINNGLKDIHLADAGWRTVGGRVYKETWVLMAIGYKSDMDRARVLEASLHIQAMRAEAEWWRENGHLYAYQKKSAQHLVRRGFLFAFADGAHVKLSEATKRGKEAAEEQHGRDSVALVLRDRSLMVQDEYDRLFPPSGRQNINDRKNKGDRFAREHGRAAGLRADVGQPGLKNDQKRLGS